GAALDHRDLRQPRRRHPLHRSRPAHSGGTHMSATQIAGRIAGVDAGAPIRQWSLWQDAWRRYLRNRGAVAAAAVFLLMVVWCVVTPIVSPHDPNEGDFATASEGPSGGRPFAS